MGQERHKTEKTGLQSKKPGLTLFSLQFRFSSGQFLRPRSEHNQEQSGVPAWFFMTCTAIEQSISESRLSFQHLLLMRYGMEFLLAHCRIVIDLRKKEEKEKKTPFTIPHS